jgi:hypothetical protein
MMMSPQQSTLRVVWPFVLVCIVCAATSAGTLPNSWGSLTNLQRIEVANTAWMPAPSPPVWPAWSFMSNLSYIDLSNSSGYNNIITGQWQCSPELHAGAGMSLFPAMRLWPAS